MHQQRGSPIFEWLVRFHYEANLPSYLEYLARRDNQFIEQGRENEATNGCLILENGDTLVGKLRQEHIILDHSSPHFVEAKTYQQFASFLAQNQHNDGAFFYDGGHQRMARVSRYSNSSPNIKAVREKQLSLIPADFVFYGGTSLAKEDLDRYIGTKTDLAMVLPVAYTAPDCQVHAYQIKRTAYNEAGMGKVTAFGPQGLEQEFFFHYEPIKKGVSVDGVTYPLVGIQRTYEPRAGRVVKVREELRDFLDEMKAA